MSFNEKSKIFEYFLDQEAERKSSFQKIRIHTITVEKYLNTVVILQLFILLHIH